MRNKLHCPACVMCAVCSSVLPSDALDHPSSVRRGKGGQGSKGRAKAKRQPDDVTIARAKGWWTESELMKTRERSKEQRKKKKEQKNQKHDPGTLG